MDGLLQGIEMKPCMFFKLSLEELLMKENGGIEITFQLKFLNVHFQNLLGKMNQLK